MQCVELQNGGSTLGKKFWQGYTENSVSYKGKGSYSVLLCKQSISTIVLISRTVILIQLPVVASGGRGCTAGELVDRAAAGTRVPDGYPGNKLPG